MTEQSKGKSMPGIPVMLKDGRIMCYWCFNNLDDGDGELDYWLPDDAENYPVECETCGITLTGRTP